MDTNDEKLITIDVFHATVVKHSEVLNNVPDLPEELADFEIARAKAHESAKVKEVDSTDSTKDAKAKKKTLGVTVIKMALRAAVQARRKSNLKLASSLTYKVSFILQAGKNTAVARAALLIGIMKDNLTELTVLKVADITLMETVLADYKGVKDEPKVVIAERKTEGTDQLTIDLRNAFVFMNGIYDLAYSYIDDTNPNIVKELASAKKVGSSVHEHNSQGGHAFDKDDKPLKDVVVTIVDTDKQAITDSEGYYNITVIKEGDCQIQAKTPGGDSFIKDAHISRGHNGDIDFHFT